MAPVSVRKIECHLCVDILAQAMGTHAQVILIPFVEKLLSGALFIKVNMFTRAGFEHDHWYARNPVVRTGKGSSMWKILHMNPSMTAAKAAKETAAYHSRIESEKQDKGHM